MKIEEIQMSIPELEHVRVSGNVSQSRRMNSNSFFNSNRQLSFFRDLDILLNSGLSLPESISILTEETNDNKLLQYLNQVQNSLNSGTSFAEAGKQSGFLSEFEYHSIAVGEETGNLDIVLNNLISYHRNKQKLLNNIIKLSAYPVMVLLSSLLAVTFMLGYVVPLFQDIFKQTQGELPWITEFISQTSSLVTDNWKYILLIVAICISLGILIYRNSLFKGLLLIITSRIPLMGVMISEVQLSRICNSMALLLRSGLSINKALYLTSGILSNTLYEPAINRVLKALENGKSLNEAMKNEKLFPVRLIRMIDVGERTNQLDSQFSNFESYLNNKIETYTSLIAAIIEPVILIILGAIVGIILIAMYLPIFQLTQGI